MDKKLKNIYFYENCFADVLSFERWKEKMNKREVMKVENLVRNYKMVYSDRQGEEEIKVLKGLDFTIEEQEFVGIMGKSGCGKTTLLKVLGLIDKPTSGKIFFSGKDASELWSDELADIRRREIGFVFQDFIC